MVVSRSLDEVARRGNGRTLPAAACGREPLSAEAAREETGCPLPTHEDERRYRCRAVLGVPRTGLVAQAEARIAAMERDLAALDAPSDARALRDSLVEFDSIWNELDADERARALSLSCEPCSSP